MLDVFHGDRVDAGEGLVEQDELRIDGQRPGDLAAAALTAGKLYALALTHFLQTEFLDQGLEPLEAVFLVKPGHLHNREDVVFHGHGPEDRGFLGEIAHAFLGTLVHREASDLFFPEENAAGIGLDQAGDHIEAGGFAGAVGAEQAHDLALFHFDRHALDDRAFAVFFDQVGTEQFHRQLISNSKSFFSALNSGEFSCKYFAFSDGIYIPRGVSSACLTSTTSRMAPSPSFF